MLSSNSPRFYQPQKRLPGYGRQRHAGITHRRENQPAVPATQFHQRFARTHANQVRVCLSVCLSIYLSFYNDAEKKIIDLRLL